MSPSHPHPHVAPELLTALRTDLSPRQTSAEQVADLLRESISNGLLKPGTRLQEELLTSSIGVARNTLREAFRSLVHERLLVHEINRGVFVTIPTADDIRDVYRFRKLIECDALASAAPEADFGELRRAVDEADTAVAVDDWPAVGTANIRFHRGVAALTGSVRSLAAMQTLLAETRLHVSAFDPQGWHEPFVSRNRRIAEVAARGEPEAASALMAETLHLACERISAMYESQQA